MLSVSETNALRRATMSVRHAIKLLETKIDSRRIARCASLAVRVKLLNYFVMQITLARSKLQLDTLAMHIDGRSS